MDGKNSDDALVIVLSLLFVIYVAISLFFALAIEGLGHDAFRFKFEPVPYSSPIEEEK